MCVCVCVDNIQNKGYVAKGSKILDGSFYRDELLKTKLNVDDIFRVEKVLKASADGKR